MRKVYKCNPYCFETHYLHKGGNIPVFVGAPTQRGHGGLGGIFSGLAKMAVPLLKSAAKSAGKTILKSGAQFAGDILSGKNIKEAAKRRALDAGKNIGKDVLSSIGDLTNSSASNKKRKASISATTLRPAKRKQTSSRAPSDIFA